MWPQINPPSTFAKGDAYRMEVSPYAKAGLTMLLTGFWLTILLHLTVRRTR